MFPNLEVAIDFPILVCGNNQILPEALAELWSQEQHTAWFAAHPVFKAFDRGSIAIAKINF